MNKIFYFILLPAFIALISCDKEKPPAATEWIGLQTKSNAPLEKTFRTTGKGVGMVTWWAGGYTWHGGRFTVELLDVKQKETILKKVYVYGDRETGNDELPKFKWWHSEEKDRIILTANTVYKMRIQGRGLAQPGAGWGLWLYKIGDEPTRHGH